MAKFTLEQHEKNMRAILAPPQKPNVIQSLLERVRTRKDVNARPKTRS